MVQHVAGGTTTHYQYNPDGIRHWQSDLLSATAYLVDTNRAYAQVLAESVDGMTDVVYHFGDDLVAQSRGGNSNYFHVDGLGSTRVLTDSSGNATDQYAYAAFGGMLSQYGLTENKYLYTGEQYDVELNQYYLRARYYDQSAGRLTRMDSWEGRPKEPISLNKYNYANADPLYFVDPSGNISIGFSLGGTLNFSLARAAIGRSVLVGGRALSLKTGAETAISLYQARAAESVRHN